MRLPRLFRRARRDDSGVAFTEFALALPFLLMTLVGGLELVNLALTHQQLSRVATSVADLAARYRSSIDETDIETLFFGSNMSTDLNEFDTRGRIILNSLTVNEDIDPATGEPTGNWIRWQRCEGDLSVVSQIGKEGDGRDDDSIPDIDGFTVADPNTVMMAEVVYDYEPLFVDGRLLAPISNVFEPRQIRYTAAFIAREISLIDITNTTNVAASDLKTCPWN